MNVPDLSFMMLVVVGTIIAAVMKVPRRHQSAAVFVDSSRPCIRPQGLVALQVCEIDDQVACSSYFMQ